MKRLSEQHMSNLEGIKSVPMRVWSLLHLVKFRIKENTLLIWEGLKIKGLRVVNVSRVSALQGCNDTASSTQWYDPLEGALF